MKTNRNLKLELASAGIVAALTMAGAATAQGIPKSGSYDFMACWSGTSNLIAFSKTHSAWSYEMMGGIRSSTPGGLFDKNSFRCVGMNASLDGKNSGSVVCEGIDADGDKRLTTFAISAEGAVTRGNVVGTGKYEGMVMSGTVIPMGSFPVVKAGTFQECNRQTGTYTLK